jgi:ATP-dependent Clp protease ATP-binding subunit ClpB
MLRQSEGVVPAIVTQVAGSVQALQDELSRELDGPPKVYGATGEVGLARPTADILQAAERYARGMGDEYVSTEHILLG